MKFLEAIALIDDSKAIMNPNGYKIIIQNDKLVSEWNEEEMATIHHINRDDWRVVDKAKLFVSFTKAIEMAAQGHQIKSNVSKFIYESKFGSLVNSNGKTPDLTRFEIEGNWYVFDKKDKHDGQKIEEDEE